MKKEIRKPKSLSSLVVRSLMMLTLLLMPLGAWAQKVATLKWGLPNVQANFQEVTQWTINWSERNGSYPILINYNQLAVTYSSSNTSVATIDGDGTITPVAPGGSTVITASYDGVDYEATSASYTLTYIDNRNSVEDLGFAFSSSAVAAIYGDATVSSPSLERGKLLGTITYSSSETSVATVDASGQVAVVGAGSTVITASYAGSVDIKPGSTSYTLTVAQKEVGLQWGTTSFIYDGSAHVPTATATGLVGADACTVTVDGAQANAGSYTATASALSNANYKLPAANTTTFTIAKAASAVAAAPTAKTLTYTGSAQELVTAGTASGGTMQYSLDNQTFSSAVPVGTNVGNYTVYYKVIGDANHDDAIGGQVSVIIAKAASAVAAAPTANTLTYTGSAQALVTAGTATGGTMQYSLDAKTYTEAVPTGTNAGNYTVYYKVVGDASHDDAVGGQVAVTINKAAVTVAFASKTANAKIGEAFTSQTATTTPAGLTLTYSSSATAVATVNASTGIVTLVAAGSTTISAVFAGNDNYNAASDSYTLTVAKADPVGVELNFASEAVTAVLGDATVTPPALNNPHQLPLSWSSSDGNVAVVSETGAITIVGAGQTIISAVFAGNDEYQAKTISYTLIVNKAVAFVAFSTSSETAALGEAFISPMATVNPAGFPLVYSSSDTSVASVDANTGEVRLEGVGVTIITATFNGSDVYNSASAYYYLTVEPARPKLEPIVKEVDYSMDEVYFVNEQHIELDLSNTIVNNILFTLKNQESPEGDGYDTEGHGIVINTTTLTSTVNALLASGVEPGSQEYASLFTGMTFIVPAGEGFIIVTSQEAEGVSLMVKVGGNDPVAIHLSELGDYSIPYKSDQLTYVYMWKENYVGHDGTFTRGKKTMADVRVTKVAYKAVSSNGIQYVKKDMPVDDRWYDMNGRRISQPVKKGVYIHGNRKVVISADQHPAAQ